jgi:hypothetical protein
VLVLAQQHAERIKDLVEQLKAKNGAEALDHAASTGFSSPFNAPRNRE